MPSRGEWRATELGLAGVRAWLGYSDYAHNELDFDAAEGHDAVGSRFTNEQLEGRAEVETVPVDTPIGRLRSMAGVQFGTRKLDGRSFEGDNLLEPNTTDTIGGYLFEEVRLSAALRVQAAGRIEHAEVYGATFDNFVLPTGIVAIDRSFDPASGSLGLLYDLPAGMVLSLTAQDVERAPVAQELFSKGAHEATGTFEIGNPDIGIEKAPLARGRAQARRRRLPLRHRRLLHEVRRLHLPRAHGRDVRRRRSPRARPAGRAASSSRWSSASSTRRSTAPRWPASMMSRRSGTGSGASPAQYDFVRARFDDGENVPRMPPHRLGGGVYYRDHAWQARLFLLHAFEQNEVAAHETPTAGYTLLTAEASYTAELAPVGNFVRELVVGVKGENLLDDEVRNSASFKKDEVLLPGASVRLFGALRF